MGTDVELDLEEEFDWVDTDIIDSLNESDAKNPSSQKPEEERQSDIQLYRFIASLQQIEHSFYIKGMTPSDLPFVSERLTDNLSLTRKLATKLDYNLKNLTHLYYFNVMLRQVSIIATASHNYGKPIHDINDDPELFENLLETNLDGVVVLEDEFSSPEVAMHIKSVLFPYTLYFNHTISAEFNGISVESYLSIVIEMTKTLATRWNKSININKRHVLFTSALDTVARFVMHNLFEYTQKNLDSKMRDLNLSSGTIWDRMEKYDLGFNDYPRKKDSLLEKIESLISAEIDAIFKKNRTLRVLISAERARLFIMERLGRTWLEFHDTVVAEYKAMDEEKKAFYLKTNSNLPDTRLLFEMLPDAVEKAFNEVSTITFDQAEFTKNCKINMSILWGVSDAVCKTKI